MILEYLSTGTYSISILNFGVYNIRDSGIPPFIKSSLIYPLNFGFLYKTPKFGLTISIPPD